MDAVATMQAELREKENAQLEEKERELQQALDALRTEHAGLVAREAELRRQLKKERRELEAEIVDGVREVGGHCARGQCETVVTRGGSAAIRGPWCGVIAIPHRGILYHTDHRSLGVLGLGGLQGSGLRFWIWIRPFWGSSLGVESGGSRV